MATWLSPALTDHRLDYDRGIKITKSKAKLTPCTPKIIRLPINHLKSQQNTKTDKYDLKMVHGILDGNI